MKRKNILGVVLAFFSLCLTGCEKYIDVDGHKVTWKNDSGEILLEKHDVPNGAMANYSYGIPTSSVYEDATFLGWSPQMSPIFKDTTYTAIYSYDGVRETYQIYYNLNGGVNSEYNPLTYQYGQSYWLYDPTKFGCNFLGWYDNDGQKIQNINPFMAGDLYLSAKWEESDTYSIVISNNINSDYEVYDVEYGQYFEYQASPSIEGNIFEGVYVNGEWYSSSTYFNAYVYGDLQVEFRYVFPFEYYLDSSTGGLVITEYRGTDKNVEIPSMIDGYHVYSIGDNCFYGKSSVQVVNVPETVCYICEYAFAYCNNLTEVNFYGDIQYFGARVFYYACLLQNVNFYGNCTFDTIYDYTFYECENLRNVSIPSSVTSIETYAFAFLYNYCTIYIPRYVNYVASYAFCECPYLTIYYGPYDSSGWEPNWYVNVGPIYTY